ncbi:MAG: hypothetical protein J5789_05990 [Oscillospiraceae bacterium]|nr:hypothetical protein [Oscillospiraceae bacterium]
MFKYIHLTKLQWLGILKWSLYGFLTLLVLMLQTVLLPQIPIGGAKLAPLPALIVCICIREGPEKGGLYAVLATLFWCLSGADFGNISVAVIPIGAILSAVLCRAVLTLRLLPAALCCLGVTLVNASAIFAFKLILPPTVALNNYWRVLLPGVGLSMAFVPLHYALVKLISRIGVQDAL